MKVGKAYIFLGYRTPEGELQRGEAEHVEFLKPVVCVEPPHNPILGLYKFIHSGRYAHLTENEVGELPSKPLEDWM